MLVLRHFFAVFAPNSLLPKYKKQAIILMLIWRTALLFKNNNPQIGLRKALFNK